jgi:hypothetical protein
MTNDEEKVTYVRETFRSSGRHIASHQHQNGPREIWALGTEVHNLLYQNKETVQAYTKARNYFNAQYPLHKPICTRESLSKLRRMLQYGDYPDPHTLFVLILKSWGVCLPTQALQATYFIPPVQENQFELSGVQNSNNTEIHNQSGHSPQQQLFQQGPNNPTIASQYLASELKYHQFLDFAQHQQSPPFISELQDTMYMPALNQQAGAPSEQLSYLNLEQLPTSPTVSQSGANFNPSDPYNLCNFTRHRGSQEGTHYSPVYNSRYLQAGGGGNGPIATSYPPQME